LLRRGPPSSRLFPYPTLFRSAGRDRSRWGTDRPPGRPGSAARRAPRRRRRRARRGAPPGARRGAPPALLARGRPQVEAEPEEEPEVPAGRQVGNVAAVGGLAGQAQGHRLIVDRDHHPLVAAAHRGAAGGARVRPLLVVARDEGGALDLGEEGQAVEAARADGEVPLGGDRPGERLALRPPLLARALEAEAAAQ